MTSSASSGRYGPPKTISPLECCLPDSWIDVGRLGRAVLARHLGRRVAGVDVEMRRDLAVEHVEVGDCDAARRHLGQDQRRVDRERRRARTTLGGGEGDDASRAPLASAAADDRRLSRVGDGASAPERAASAPRPVPRARARRRAARRRRPHRPRAGWTRVSTSRLWATARIGGWRLPVSSLMRRHSSASVDSSAASRTTSCCSLMLRQRRAQVARDGDGHAVALQRPNDRVAGRAVGGEQQNAVRQRTDLRPDAETRPARRLVPPNAAESSNRCRRVQPHPTAPDRHRTTGGYTSSQPFSSAAVQRTTERGTSHGKENHATL